MVTKLENGNYHISKVLFNVIIIVVPFIVGALIAWGATRADIGYLKGDVIAMKNDYEKIRAVLWEDNGGIVAALARIETNQKIILQKLKVNDKE